MRLALDTPDRVAGLVLVTPAFMPGERDEDELALWDRLADGLRNGGVFRLRRGLRGSPVPEQWKDTVVKVIRHWNHLDALLPMEENRPVLQPRMLVLGLALLAVVPADALAAAPLKPTVGKRFVATPVSGRVLVRAPKARSFRPLSAAAIVAAGSELDTKTGVVQLTVARDRKGATDSITVDKGRFLATQNSTAAPITELDLSEPLTGCTTRNTGARLAARPRRRSVRSRTRRGRFRAKGQYAATAVQGTRWSVTDGCGFTTASVTEGRVLVTDLRTNRTFVVGPGQRYTAHKTPVGPVGTYTCSGPETLLFDSYNTGAVDGGGKPPTFTTGPQVYCLTSIATYHFGPRKKPGTIELTSPAEDGETLGPFPATEAAGAFDWVATPTALDGQVLLSGTYQCRDSDPSTWSQNSESKGLGFCRVRAIPAQRVG